MIGWIRRLFTGEPDCNHEYEEVGRYKVSDQLYGNCLAIEYHLKCKTCGWVCKRTL